MQRSWLLTWTTYGTWLPGDERGFVGDVIDPDAVRRNHNVHGTSHSADHSPLHAYAAAVLTGPPVMLNQAQAVAVADQLRETAGYRQWDLHALAIMSNHVHLVITVAEDVLSEKIQGDFKAWGTRRLDRDWGKPNGSWWTEGGSRRPLRGDEAVARAIEYLRTTGISAHPLDSRGGGFLSGEA